MLDILIPTPLAAIPHGGTVEIVLTADRVRLRLAKWRRAGGESRGTICLMQGRAEFIEKYFETIADLRRRGFDVVAFDWRGQGGSERQLTNARKGHIDDFELYLRDLDAVLQAAATHECPKPWYALAHSMGGNILMLALERGETRFERVVLSAPMIALTGLPSERGAKLLASSLNILGFGGSFVPGGNAVSISTKAFEGNKLSSDPERYSRNAMILAAEPRLGIGDPTVGWVDAAFRAMSELGDHDFGMRIGTPVLMIYPGADRLCSGPAVAAFAQRVRLCRAVEIAGARHEILMERDSLRQQFLAAFDAFIPGESAVTSDPTRVAGKPVAA